MKEMKNKAETSIVHAMCECGGEFKRNGMVLMTYPEQYSHDCDRCGKREVVYEQSPKIEYVEAEA